MHAKPTDIDCSITQLLICTLSVALCSCQRDAYPQSQHMSEYLEQLCPHGLFVTFLQDTAWDHHFLLDLLTSPETCFPTYLIKYLRYTHRSWPAFCEACRQLPSLTEEENDPSLSSTRSPSECPHSNSVEVHSNRIDETRTEVQDGVPVATMGLVEYSDSESDRSEDNSADIGTEQALDMVSDDEGPCQPNAGLDRVMSVLIRLRLAVERLQCSELFPYNAQPLLAVLEQCEHLYDQ